MIIDLNLEEKVNKAYWSYITDYRRFQILKGGAGAGKSVFIAQKIIANFLINKNTVYNGLVLRANGVDNHNSTFAELQKSIIAWGLQSLFHVNRSKGAEEITYKRNGNKVIFRGLDDVEKIKSVTFPTGDLIFVWIEEASETKETDFDQLNIRLRGISDIPKHIILSFNPIDVDSWLKKRFFDSPIPEEDGFILESTYTDNQFLDDAYKSELEGYKDKDYYYYQVYVLNQWGSRNTRAVFSNIKLWDFDIEEQHYKNIRYGQDYGFNHANAMMGTGWIDGELYLFREWYAKKQLNKEFIQSVEDSGLEHDWPITGDSANPDKIAEWSEAGYNIVGAKKGPGSLKDGIEFLKGLPCIHIHKTRCPNAAREFMRFKYRQLRDGRILDEYVEIDDDTIAATRYAIEEFIHNVEEEHFFIKRRW